MRIVHVITRLIIGGAQENTLLTCEGLSARGHEVHLISGPTEGPEGSLARRARTGPYHFEELPDLVRQVSPLRDFAALRSLRQTFELLRPDVVHTHSSKAGVLGRIAADLAGVPLIVHTIHGMSFNRTQSELTSAMYAAAERHCARRCHGIVSVADAMTRQALAAGVGRPEQFRTIRSGIVTADFDPAKHDGRELRRQWGVSDSDVLVGTVARLFVNKGYEQLIPIMSLAAKRNGHLKFVWVGDGAQREKYEAELSKRGLRHRVIITGLLPPSEMPRVLSSIDLLAHTSQWEGLPRAVVQAMLMERPAISFDIDGAQEVVKPGETGELVRLGDLEGFAEVIVKLSADDALRNRYGASGRALCLREFDHRVMVERLEALYGELSPR